MNDAQLVVFLTGLSSRLTEEILQLKKAIPPVTPANFQGTIEHAYPELQGLEEIATDLRHAIKVLSNNGHAFSLKSE